MAECSEVMKQYTVRDAVPAYQLAPTEVALDDVPPGYKRTEAGVIPEDWSVCALREGVNLHSGHHVLAKHCNTAGAGIPYLTGPADFPGGFIRQTKFTTKPTTICETGDLLLTVKGSGAGSLVEADGQYCISRQLMAVRVTKWDPRFVYFSLLENSSALADAVTGLIPGLSRGDVLSQVLPIPDNATEQRAIATALSDADALIESLDRLIAKKRAIKQAAMQQLLTGQTRLPGFAGEWETKRLGEFVCIRNQKVMPSSVDPATPCIELEHIGQGDGRLLTHSTARHSNATKYQFRAGDVLFGRLRSYLRKYWLANRDGICTTEIWPLRVDPSQAVSGFLLGIVQSERFVDSASISYGTHMPRADWKVLKNFEVSLPTVDEQAAIATVLSDMDAEIKALERRRDKARQIKQGMMQQLLTGRVRLVKAESIAERADANTKARKPHSWAFNEAVVISTLANHFGSEDFPLGRKRYTKLSYLLHRHTEREAEGYLKKAAGPYNPRTKYGGPERIALENGYIQKHKGRKGHSGFIAADNITQAEGYFKKWYGSDAIRWLEQFRFKKNDELELLATVDMAISELRRRGETVRIEAVKNVIRAHSEWKAKLQRQAFSDANIAVAIETSQKIFCSMEASS